MADFSCSPRMPPTKRRRLRGLVDWHSHTTKTRHPRVRSSLVLRMSRAMLPFIFCLQKAALVEGHTELRQPW
jgi:hypothetical protein